MNEADLKVLSELERITRSMLEQAQCADWEQVATLEQARKSFSSHDFGVEDSTEDLRLIQTRLRKLIELDNQIMMLAKARRSELGVQLGLLNQGRKANKAYQHFVLPK
jgi:hypothetical protein